MNKNTNEKSVVKRIVASKCEVVKMGIDQHARDVVVSVQLDGSVPQRAEDDGGAIARDRARADRGEEAGVGGVRDRPVRFLAGARAVEDRKRLRDQLRNDRNAWADRGRKRMLLAGHHVGGAWWTERLWKALAPTLPAWLMADLREMRLVLQQLDKQEKALREELEQAAPKDLPKAVGALTWIALLREIGTWTRFKNRRQVAGYTGLCPGVDQSGTHHRDGHINRHGNPRVRALLIELVWRLVRWQPDYPPVRKLVEGARRGSAQTRGGRRPAPRGRPVAPGHRADHTAKPQADRADAWLNGARTLPLKFHFPPAT